MEHNQPSNNLFTNIVRVIVFWVKFKLGIKPKSYWRYVEREQRRLERESQ